MRNILITGGAGFIGSNFTHFWHCKFPDDRVIVLDMLTYAGNIASIQGLIDDNHVIFIHGDICNTRIVAELFETYAIDTLVHFAAESHVDRSIQDSGAFIQTNVVGTHVLLSVSLNAWKGDFQKKKFHHISTDEVYGDLGPDDPSFTEQTPYAPRSPYSASKASSDHLVRSFGITYGLPVTITNCSNNYGPFQLTEKLIPLVITNALEGKPIPVYGHGKNIRDWLHVEDHCRAIAGVLEKGHNGETYNVGGDNELVNIDLVLEICRMVDGALKDKPALQRQFPQSAIANGGMSEALICFVEDRLGHDRRYAVNGGKIFNDTGFRPAVDFTTGMESTVRWYLENKEWWRAS